MKAHTASLAIVTLLVSTPTVAQQPGEKPEIPPTHNGAMFAERADRPIWNPTRVLLRRERHSIATDWAEDKDSTWRGRAMEDGSKRDIAVVSHAASLVN